MHGHLAFVSIGAAQNQSEAAERGRHRAFWPIRIW
jgi:hypothetical protein